jgi:proteasome lid subunit RPN8/RPN11
MIKIEERLLDEIKRQAEREYPRECCGLLIGRIQEGGRTRAVTRTYPVSNSWEESEAMHHRMLIQPADYMRAERQFAREGLGVVGNYHSHPDHPAVPSEFDLAHLAPWPTMSYIVVSVGEGRAIDLRSWELAADRSRFNEEEILKGS